MINTRVTSALVLAAFIVTAAGCSISYSSKSSSDSSASLASSSASSTGGAVDKDKVAYRDDIANLTYSKAGSSIRPEDFPVAIARTAQQFKITDWAQEKTTFYGIGKGLKKSGVPKEKAGTQPFLSQAIRYNKDSVKLIQDGYSQ